MQNVSDGDEDEDDDEDDDDEDENEVDKVKKSTPSEYKHLIAIQAGKPKGGMTECLKVDPDKVRRLSLSEEQLEDASEKYGTQIVRYSHEFLLKIIKKKKSSTILTYSVAVCIKKLC